MKRAQDQNADTAGPKSHEARGAQPAGGNVPSQKNGVPAEADRASEIGAVDQSGTVSAGFLNPRATRQVTPSYPDFARKSGVQGVVRVYVAVHESGKVSTVFKSEGHVLLRKAAESAAKQWKFPPTVIDWKSVKVTGYIEFDFKL